MRLLGRRSEQAARVAQPYDPPIWSRRGFPTRLLYAITGSWGRGSARPDPEYRRLAPGGSARGVAASVSAPAPHEHRRRVNFMAFPSYGMSLVNLPVAPATPYPATAGNAATVAVGRATRSCRRASFGPMAFGPARSLITAPAVELDCRIDNFAGQRY